MKNLFSRFQDFGSRPGRWVFMESSDGDPETEAGKLIEEKEEVDLLPSFSIRNIKLLDQDHEKLEEPNNRKKFQTFVEHQLTIAEIDNEGSRYYPPRVLLAITGSANLQKYLTSKQKDRLNNVLNVEKSEVQNKVLKLDPTKWTVQQTLHVTGVYETLKKKKGNLNDEEKKLFGILAKKIIAKGVSILATYRLIKAGGFDESAIFQSHAERLLLLELYRVNPEEHNWETKYKTEIQNADGTAAVQMLPFVDVLKELSKDVASGIVDDTRKNDRQTILFWETIDELQDDKLIGLDLDLNLSEDGKKNLQENIKRTNVAQFLLWARGRSELLPAQYKLLKKLENKDLQFSDNNFRELKADGEDLNSLNTKLKAIESELNDVRTDLAILKNQDIKSVLELFKDNSEAGVRKLSRNTREKLKETKEVYERVLQVKNNYLESAVDDNLLGEPDEHIFSEASANGLDDFEKDFKENFEFLSKSENLKNLKDGYVDRIKHLREVIENYDAKYKTILNRLKERFDRDSSDSEARDSHDKLNEEYNRFADFFNGTQANQFDGFNKKLERLEKVGGDFVKAEKEFEEDINLYRTTEEKADNGEYEEKRNGLEKDKEELEAQMAKIRGENEDEEVFVEHLNEPNKLAKDLKKDFENKLITRGRENNNILSSDLVLYYDDEVLARRILDTDNVKRWDKIKSFREEKVDPLFASLDIDNLKSYEDFENIVLGDMAVFEEVFGEKQSPKEIVDGIVLYYKEKILDKIKDDNINVSENFYDDMYKKLRIHGTARDSMEIGKMEVDSRKYANDQLNERAIIETENDKYNGVTSRIENDNVKNQLQDVFRHRKKILVEGDTVDGDYIPGMDALRTMDVKTADIFRELNETQSDIGGKLSLLQAKLLDLEKSDELDDKKKLKHKEIQAEIKNVIEQWQQETYNKLKGQIDSIEKICRNVLGGDFKKNFVDFFERAKKYLEGINGDFDDFYNEYFAGNRADKIDAFEHLLNGTPKKLSELAVSLRFDSGFWQEKQEEVIDSFSRSSDAINTLDEFGLFDQDGADADGYNYEKAQKEFEENRKVFSKKYGEYTKSRRKIVRAVTRDCGNLYDDDFMKKYGFDKETAQRKIIPELNSANAEFDKTWEKFNGKNSFWDDFEEEWKTGDPEKRSKAMEGLENWKDLAEHVDVMANKNIEYEAWLKDYDEKSSIWHRKGFRCFSGGVEVQWFSLLSIYETVKQVLEARDRKLKRDTDKMVGSLGTKLFGTKGNIGKEFYRLLNKSEDERVGEFKSGYEDAEDYELRDAMNSSSDQDEIRAIIDMLNERGVLHWDDPILLRALGRIGNIGFNLPEDIDEQSLVELQAKIGDACAGIWGKQVYRTWENSNSSNMEKKVSEYESIFYNDNRRSDTMASMLKSWANGTNSGEVDAAKYEAYIAIAIKDGKMAPRHRFYYLIMGVATKDGDGKSLLSKEAFTRLSKGDYFGIMPEMEFFDPDMEAYKKDGRVYSDETEAALVGATKYKGWTTNDLSCWVNMLGGNSFYPDNEKLNLFVQEVIEESAVVQIRHSKKNDTGTLKSKVDVDDMPIKAPNITLNTIDDLGRKESSGGSKLDPEKWRGLLQGYKDYLELQHGRIKHNDMVKPKENVLWWDFERERVLEDVARVMKLAFKMEQLLVGNYIAEGPKGALNKTQFLTADEWNGKTSYPPEENAKFISGVINNLFENQNFFAEENRKFREYMKDNNKEGYDNADFRELFDLKNRGAIMQDKRQYLHDMSCRIVYDNKMDHYFNKPDKVWEALDGYISSK